MKSDNFVYILECRDSSLYTGWTNNLSARIKKHNCKKASKYTASRTPVKLVYKKGYETKNEAMRAEILIKSLKRSEKLNLIENNEDILEKRKS